MGNPIEPPVRSAARSPDRDLADVLRQHEGPRTLGLDAPAHASPTGSRNDRLVHRPGGEARLELLPQLVVAQPAGDRPVRFRAVRGPRVTVAISTYQRAHLLPALLRALEQQTLPHGEFSVVIADNGATDSTADVLADLAATTPIQLTVVRAEQNRGPAVGRNLAWRAATAPIIAFTDDDCLPTPGWLEAGLRAMGEERLVCVGRTSPHPDEAHLTAGPFARTVRVDDARHFQTCNVFYRRADIDAVGGFDEAFDEPAGEDTDLGLRVVEAGAGAVFAAEAEVFHGVRPSSFRSTVRETLRWTGIPRVIRLHPHRRDLLHRRLFWKPSHPVVMLAAVGLIVAVRRPAALLLLAPWVHHRIRTAPLSEGRRRRWLVLPGAFAIDALEVAVMVRGSVRARVLVL